LAYPTFQEHLATITGVANHIQWALNCFPTTPSEHDYNLKFSLNNYLYILLCSFLDAWKELEGMGDDPRIQETLYIISPAIRRIRKWPGLNKVRSQLLAHHQRDKNGAFVQPWEVFGRFEAPTSFAETMLLGHCAQVAKETLLRRHSNDWEEMSSYLGSQDRRIKTKGIMTKEEVEDEITRIRQEIIERERNPAPIKDEGRT